ncbi:MAG: pyruvate, phosphate dikinase [Candidatus Aquicultor primus]|uniref:Pyruvate, phosphate dikinase n=1 Tax=Candidatus Aquicultor primus TaxID=1797195 RepID=A0A1F2UHY5_9ACTN|nr:MAG: pyruvate, phosphate dikinase [Candidatus Aquicultor primus]HCG99046.1 pyruvate, phosphate dikinase [Actinomycetota bacterium]
MPGSKKYVYDFNEGTAEMKYILGGKGANLAEMTRIDLPVPPGFTISTGACNEYYQTGAFPDGLRQEIDTHHEALERKMGKKLGDPDDPLLVSVRSGAAFSMPGMMDTVLNLGMNDEAIKGLTKQTGDERFAYDSYRRFIQMFGKVVLRIEGGLFEDAINELKEKKDVKLDTDLTANDLKDLVRMFKEIVREHSGREFPTDPKEQLILSIEAVFKSWGNKRAVDYRKLYKIPDDLGTAVNIQTMVFGNKGDDSATGVTFTRDPATGEDVPYGDYLINAQGEDVVAGIRVTEPLLNLKVEMPALADELFKNMDILEKHYRDMCDIEFTIEQGKLWMLQTRIGKRTAAAALRIAAEMVEEGLITKREAVQRIDPEQLDQLLHPQFDPKAKIKVLTKGLNASPGAAVGKVVFDADTAEERGQNGEKVILTRWETTPDDLHGMVAAQGILTSHGGKTSHAAVVARGMGKPCVCGADAIKIDSKNKVFTVNGIEVKEGDIISIDGTTGSVVVGAVELVPPKPTKEFELILGWADEIRTLGVRTNADTPEDSEKGRQFGAEGIGLARTEHMFLGDRLPIVQQMILAKNADEEKDALAKLLKVQRDDFLGIFKAMDGLPVTIRLLDPPLHEFLPRQIDLKVEITKMEMSGATDAELAPKSELLDAVERMAEMNPMLGLRGCRLGITHPEIYKMQVRAIMEAACRLKKEGGDPRVEIMIPLVAHVNELDILRKESEEVVAEVIAASGVDVEYKIGTMIEIPRAAVTADEIATVADFFSFGTNDLTQMAFGFSRDDIEAKFLPRYLERKILPRNPFETIDDGVAALVKMGCDKGRATKPDLKLGVCGEHGGDPDSVKKFHEIGLSYVSCSPYRVPLARLAAAQAVLGAGSTSSK